MSQRVIGAEITREQNYITGCTKNLPYAASVITDEWKIKKDGSVRVEQNQFISSVKAKKALFIGKGGKTPEEKLVNMPARKWKQIFGLRLHLFFICES